MSKDGQKVLCTDTDLRATVARDFVALSPAERARYEERSKIAKDTAQITREQLKRRRLNDGCDPMPAVAHSTPATATLVGGVADAHLRELQVAQGVPAPALKPVPMWSTAPPVAVLGTEFQYHLASSEPVATPAQLCTVPSDVARTPTSPDDAELHPIGLKRFEEALFTKPFKQHATT